MHTNTYSEITPEILKLSKLCTETATIDPALYSEYDVKRGLRDVNGKGVLVGLTQISDVRATTDSLYLPTATYITADTT